MGSPWFDTLIDQLRLEDLPIQPVTRRMLEPVLADEWAGLRRIAQVVLGDPGLAVRVLQQANAVELRYPGPEIVTLEDAIHRLGLRRLAELAQGAVVDESCLDERRLVYYRQGCARAWLAALLAQDWAECDRDRVPAEVALAALLNNLGELSWLVHGDGRIQRYLEILAHPAVLPHEAEYVALGANLEWLGYRLAVKWGLPEMVRESMRARNARHLRPLYVMLATQIARHALGGWRCLGQLGDLTLAAELLQLDLGSFRARVDRVLDHFNERAAQYGLAQLAHLPPLGEGLASAGHASSCMPPFCLAPRADELARARELLASDQIQDPAQIILVWLEGLHHGLGLNRVLYASLEAQTGTLNADQLMGADFELAFSRFNLRLDEAGPFARLLEGSGVRWLRLDAVSSTESLPQSVKILTGGVPCLARSVWLEERPVGLIYADRRATACALDDHACQGFLALSDLAESALARLLLRSKAGAGAPVRGQGFPPDGLAGAR